MVELEVANRGKCMTRAAHANTRQLTCRPKTTLHFVIPQSSCHSMSLSPPMAGRYCALAPTALTSHRPRSSHLNLRVSSKNFLRIIRMADNLDVLDACTKLIKDS